MEQRIKELEKRIEHRERGGEEKKYSDKEGENTER